jgi:hypothetical protein
LPLNLCRDECPECPLPTSKSSSFKSHCHNSRECHDVTSPDFPGHFP